MEEAEVDAKGLEAIEEGLLPEGNKATPVAKCKGFGGPSNVTS